MKTISSLILLLSIGATAIAQSGKNVENHQLTLNVLLPGIIYEQGLSQNSTIAAEATMGFAYRESDFLESGFGIYPIGRLQYRHYYNFARRLAKGKNIAGNTGNYIAPTIAIQGGKAIIGDLDYVSDYFGAIGAVYGLQRTGQKGLQFRFEVGPGYFFDEFESNFGIFLALKLGWVVRRG
ncbi:secreted protein [Allomuricauda ruestringensis DSM 13258]|uniref:Secreted protein n=1 Tax=Allomuricauda ruestringensis (strain DSM 13258 / CIP 107369 / LMG 19739 / B1) TaxID=886377 RepID=G2PSU2_ALLRU|nr:hypothetical protein [Allomuricauda ruestringensis]AEM69569.1 secreted protein [Allomuricauda ruestringensis DSM 13258]